MKPLAAFTGKEFLELIRTGKFLILTVLFILFGIMNPAIAKLTPWLMETAFQDTPGVTLVFTDMEINALTSWAQFYKNIPMALVVFLLMFSSILTLEYQKGTLINMITKGLHRWKILTAKTFTTAAFWTLGYWITFGITYGYNAYFWDNAIASHLFFAAFCFYLSGLWLISLLFLMSALFQSNSAVLLALGMVFLISWLSGLLPDIRKYAPGTLMKASELLNGAGKITDYSCTIAVTILLLVFHFALTVFFFNRKKL